MPPQGSDTLCSRFHTWIPDFQGVIVGDGDESAIGEQEDAAYPLSVFPQGSDTLCSRFLAWVPDFQDATGGAGDESAIGEQGDAVDPVSVLPQGNNTFYAHRPVAQVAMQGTLP